MRLSVAAPAYNEAAGIKTLVSGWHEFLSHCPDITQFEIVVCNDGSQDNTGALLDDLATCYPEIRPVHVDNNQGAAAALSAAIRHTQFEWVLLIDADGQFPIENVTLLLSAMKTSGACAILGVRCKQDRAWARLGSQMSGMVCNWFHGSRLKDFNCACKLVSGPLLRSLSLEAKGMNYSTEITSRLLESLRYPQNADACMVEVDIEHRPRNMGKSNLKLVRDSLHRLLFVVYLALRQGLLKWGILRCPYEGEKSTK